MRTLNQVLFESRLRTENLKDAIRLGIFGNNRDDVIKNVIDYNIKKEPIVTKACQELNLYLRRKNHD